MKLHSLEVNYCFQRRPFSSWTLIYDNLPNKVRKKSEIT